MIAKVGPLAKRDSCAGVRGVLERFMTHFCLLVFEGADVVGGTGVFVVMVVVLALLTLLVYCLFAAFGGSA